jgi:hypothetical protein
MNISNCPTAAAGALYGPQRPELIHGAIAGNY